jgi:transposase
LAIIKNEIENKTKWSSAIDLHKKLLAEVKLKNHNLARANGGFYEFKRQVTYKSNWYGTIHTTVDTFYPSGS